MLGEWNPFFFLNEKQDALLVVPLSQLGFEEKEQIEGVLKKKKNKLQIL